MSVPSVDRTSQHTSSLYMGCVVEFPGKHTKNIQYNIFILLKKKKFD